MKIAAFSLYVLFSHLRPRNADATEAISFFQMSSYAGANVRITYENRGKIPRRTPRDLKWKPCLQAKRVNSFDKTIFPML